MSHYQQTKAYLSKLISSQHFILFTFFCSCFVLGLMLPITQDEAYYAAWGKNLSWGYFDHPPGVALLTALSGLLPGSVLLKQRLITIVLSFIGLAVLFRLYNQYLLKNPKYLMTTKIIAVGNFACLAFGLFSTPDTVLFFAWICALHEAAAALQGKPKRWLTTGFFVGIGLLGKFTMLVMGPVLLMSLISINRDQLKMRWPYLGGVVALLIFSPNLIWNAQNDWITWKFQLKHGLSQQRNHLFDSQLPSPRLAKLGDPEYSLAKVFLDEEPKSDQAIQSYNKFFAYLKSFTSAKSALSRLGDYVGGQIAMWGFLLFVFLHGWLRRKKEATPVNAHEHSMENLFFYSALIPLLIFLMFAANGKVEANWAAMYVFGAVPLLVQCFRPNFWLSVLGASLNVTLLIFAAHYARSPGMGVKAKFDRILKETYGYEKLSQFEKLQTKALYADTYQLVSMLNYYNPQLDVAQWPGYTRPSEFVQSETFWNKFSLESLKNQKGFHVISHEKIPRVIDGFKAIDFSRIRDCKEGQLEVTKYSQDVEATHCTKVHTWYLAEYVPK